MSSIRLWSAALVSLAALSGCATLPEPLTVTVAGIEQLPGEGMEMRMLVKLRVQNPNEKVIEYKGSSVKIDVQGSSLASGVTDEAGTIPSFGEGIVSVPVTISLMSALRQALAALNGGSIPEKVTYQLSGTLHTGGFSPVRFKASGELELPKNLGQGLPAPTG
jgi:LEA14-like dessication related protein